jgi:putative aldouronate transport system substrate-binding protein
MSEQDAVEATKYETDIKQYVEQKKADWILNGGVDKDWKAYKQKLEDLGLSKYLKIKQKYMDEYLGK